MKDITNFRALGGFVNIRGQRLRSGLLMRAAAPRYLARSELQAMAERGVRLICDFRSDGERPNDPAPWAEELGMRYLLPNRGRDVGDPLVALLKATVDRPTTEALLHEVYRNIPYDQALSFKALFAELVAGTFPALYHCASGKDRTGVFTALLLTTLGIPRDTIDRDFEHSNLAIDWITADFMAHPRLEPVWTAPFDVWSPLMESNRAWLDTMFATLADKHGSTEGYLEEVLGVGAAERHELRRHLLEVA